MTGYRISYSTGTDQGSADVGADATDHTITITQPQSQLTYSISIITLSSQLPSSVAGPIMVTVRKQNTTRFLFCTGILHITYNSNYHYQTNGLWKEKINNQNCVLHFIMSSHCSFFSFHGISFYGEKSWKRVIKLSFLTPTLRFYYYTNRHTHHYFYQ